MDFAKDWIIQNFGVSALILIGLIVLAWFLGSWITKIKKDVENKPCDAHQKMLEEQSRKLDQDSVLLHKIEGQLSTLTHLEASIQRMTDTIQLMTASYSGPSPLTQSHSPISLTEKGKEIAEELDLDSVLNANWDKIVQIITTETNPYDIQMRFISDLILKPDSYIDVDSMDRIKTNAFANGIPLIDYMRMLGVMARDKYFSIHGIDVNEVDRNDPNVKAESSN